MSRKYLLTFSLLLPLMAVSAVADAGTTISDKRYWPNEARPRAANNLADHSTDSHTMGALNWIAPQAQPATSVSRGSPLGRYQGGPKSR